jgi:putative pre-16S rRNA nuclease
MTNIYKGSDFPGTGRLIGVDFGRKRVGFSISSPDQKYSSPMDNYTRKNEEADSRKIKQMVEENRAVGIVIGLPVHMSGDEGELAKASREYGEWLNELTSLPVIYWDERFTSSSADDLLKGANLSWKKRKSKLDKLAAHLMLQSFLDAPDRNMKPLDIREDI